MLLRELYAVSTLLSSQTELLSTGATRWSWEILSSTPSSPYAAGDTLLQIFEIFDQDTTITLYGGTSSVQVRADTVYYSQVVNVSSWNLSPSATGLRFVTWEILNTDAPGSSLVSTSTSTSLSRDISCNQFSAHLSLSKTMVVDGVQVSSTFSDFVTDAESLIYATNQQGPVPAVYAKQSFELRVSPASNARLPLKIKLGLEGYQKSTIAVGVVLGLPALVSIIAFATYLFCLGTWLSIWAVISIPGRIVVRRFKMCFRPPAPTFEFEEEEGEEEDDPLDMERVDSEQLLKFAGGTHIAASLKHHQRNDTGSTDNVLSRLRKAMGRRLSNFVGWDGPPPPTPGSSAPGTPNSSIGGGGDRSPSPGKKNRIKSKKTKEHVRGSSNGGGGDDSARIISEESMPGLHELEGSSGNNIMMASMYSSRGMNQGGQQDAADTSVRLLSDRDESPSPSMHRRDPSSGSSSSDREEPPRQRKPPGLRGFKITTSQTSPTQDVIITLASPTTPATATTLVGTADSPTSSLPTSQHASPEHQHNDEADPLL